MRLFQLIINVFNLFFIVLISYRYGSLWLASAKEYKSLLYYQAWYLVDEFYRELSWLLHYFNLKLQLTFSSVVTNYLIEHYFKLDKLGSTIAL